MTDDNPIDVIPDDLALYMGVDDINEDRAQLLIDSVIDLCTAIVSPLENTARGVVLSAAARAYATPPGGATSELVGPYQATRPSAGIYLTRGERASLRALSGGGGAFSFDMLPTGYPDSVFADD